VIRVAVTGATGRMGSEVCRAVAAADDLELVAAVSPSHAGTPLGELVPGLPEPDRHLTLTGDLAGLVDAGAEVAVEFSRPPHGGPNTLALLEAGIHAVVGTTGITDEELDRIGAAATAGAANALVAPNFAIGAVLLMELAARVARHLPHVEIVELHHDGKADAPSGTALRTARLVAEARGTAPSAPAGDGSHPGARGAEVDGVRVHSVRLPGLVAHQEVLFGGEGETLSLRHDSIDRRGFMPGVLLGVRRVAGLDGLTVGLEHLLD
jgi:4-hydroxy-tetrahydrodipicolinate reductase